MALGPAENLNAVVSESTGSVTPTLPPSTFLSSNAAGVASTVATATAKLYDEARAAIDSALTKNIIEEHIAEFLKNKVTEHQNNSARLNKLDDPVSPKDATTVINLLTRLEKTIGLEGTKFTAAALLLDGGAASVFQAEERGIFDGTKSWEEIRQFLIDERSWLITRFYIDGRYTDFIAAQFPEIKSFAEDREIESATALDPVTLRTLGRPALTVDQAMRMLDITKQQAINALSFLQGIAFAEGTLTTKFDGGYRVGFGYSEIVGDLSDHPGTLYGYGSRGTTAAGRYQFLRETWNRLAEERRQVTGYNNFFPFSQDISALLLIKENSAAWGNVIAGTFGQAVHLLAPTWASFPNERGVSNYPPQRAKPREQIVSVINGMVQYYDKMDSENYDAPQLPGEV